MNFEKLQESVAEALDRRRFLHTVGVRYTAASLAMAHGVDLEKAQIAGILHDCAKNLPVEVNIRICTEGEDPPTEIERLNPALLHAKAGAVLAKETYGVSDPEILGAIRFHTTGRAGMTRLEKIIFIADYIEPGRPLYGNMEACRRSAFSDLDRAVYLELEASLFSIRERGLILDPATEEAYRYYRQD